MASKPDVVDSQAMIQRNEDTELLHSSVVDETHSTLNYPEWQKERDRADIDALVWAFWKGGDRPDFFERLTERVCSGCGSVGSAICCDC